MIPNKMHCSTNLASASSFPVVPQQQHIFNSLPEVLKPYTAAFLPLNDLVHLALTSTKYSHILKGKENGNLSPYLIHKLRSFKWISTFQLHFYTCITKIADISQFLRYCDSLTTLELRGCAPPFRFLAECEKPFVTNSNELIYPPNLLVNAVKACPNLITLRLLFPIEAQIQAILPILQDCQNLEELHLNPTFIHFHCKIDIIGKTCPDLKIKRLKVEAPHSPSFPEAILTFISSLKHLSSLHLRKDQEFSESEIKHIRDGLTNRKIELILMEPSEYRIKAYNKR